MLWAANCTSILGCLQWPFQTLTFPRHHPHPLDWAPDPALVHDKLKAWVHQLDTRAPVGNKTGQSVTVLPASLGSMSKQSSACCSSEKLHSHHTALQVGRDLWSSSCPSPLLEHGHPDPAAQYHIQTTPEHLQGGRLHGLSGHPVPVPGPLHSGKVFPHVQREPPVLQCVPISSEHHWEEPGSVFLTASPVKLNSLDLSLLQAERPQLPQPLFTGKMLQPRHHLDGPSMDSAQWTHLAEGDNQWQVRELRSSNNNKKNPGELLHKR